MEEIVNLEQKYKESIQNLKEMKQKLIEQTRTNAQVDNTSCKNNINLKLKPPWEEYFDEDYKCPYYYNAVTQESTWDFPMQENNEVGGDDLHDDIFHGIDFMNQNIVENGNDNGTLQHSEPTHEGISPNSDPVGVNVMHNMNKNDFLADKQEDMNIESDLESLPLTPTDQQLKYRNHVSSIAERSAALLKQKEARERHTREVLLKKEEEELKYVPAITSKSSKLIPKRRSVNDMLQWEKERKERLQAKAEELRKSEEETVTAKPAINKYYVKQTHSEPHCAREAVVAVGTKDSTSANRVAADAHDESSQEDTSAAPTPQSVENTETLNGHLMPSDNESVPESVVDDQGSLSHSDNNERINVNERSSVSAPNTASKLPVKARAKLNLMHATPDNAHNGNSKTKHDFASRLHAKGEEYKIKVEQLRIERELEAKKLAHPVLATTSRPVTVTSINVASKNLPEKLGSDSAPSSPPSRPPRPVTRKTVVPARPLNQKVISVNTSNSVPFQPMVNKKSEEILMKRMQAQKQNPNRSTFALNELSPSHAPISIRDLPVESRLTQHGHMTQLKLAKQKDKIERELGEKLRVGTKLNATSEKILKEKQEKTKGGKESADSLGSRLTKPIGCIRPKAMELIEKEAHCTFKPKLNPNMFSGRRGVHVNSGPRYASPLKRMSVPKSTSNSLLNGKVDESGSDVHACGPHSPWARKHGASPSPSSLGGSSGSPSRYNRPQNYAEDSYPIDSCGTPKNEDRIRSSVKIPQSQDDDFYLISDQAYPGMFSEKFARNEEFNYRVKNNSSKSLISRLTVTDSSHPASSAISIHDKNQYDVNAGDMLSVPSLTDIAGFPLNPASVDEHSGGTDMDTGGLKANPYVNYILENVAQAPTGSSDEMPMSAPALVHRELSNPYVNYILENVAQAPTGSSDKMSLSSQNVHEARSSKFDETRYQWESGFDPSDGVVEVEDDAHIEDWLSQHYYNSASTPYANTDSFERFEQVQGHSGSMSHFPRYANYQGNEVTPQIRTQTAENVGGSFRSKSNGSSVGKEENSRETSGNDKNEKLYAKSKQWVKQREEKLRAERMQREKMLAEECSFKPKIGGTGKKTKKSASPAGLRVGIGDSSRHVSPAKLRPSFYSHEADDTSQIQSNIASASPLPPPPTYLVDTAPPVDGKNRSVCLLASPLRPVAPDHLVKQLLSPPECVHSAEEEVTRSLPGQNDFENPKSPTEPSSYARAPDIVPPTNGPVATSVSALIYYDNSVAANLGSRMDSRRSCHSVSVNDQCGGQKNDRATCRTSSSTITSHQDFNNNNSPAAYDVPHEVNLPYHFASSSVGEGPRTPPHSKDLLDMVAYPTPYPPDSTPPPLEDSPMPPLPPETPPPPEIEHTAISEAKPHAGPTGEHVSSTNSPYDQAHFLNTPPEKSDKTDIEMEDSTRKYDLSYFMSSQALPPSEDDVMDEEDPIKLLANARMKNLVLIEYGVDHHTAHTASKKIDQSRDHPDDAKFLNKYRGFPAHHASSMFSTPPPPSVPYHSIDTPPDSMQKRIDLL